MTRRDLIVVGALAACVLALTAWVWARPGHAFFNHGDLYAYHWPLRHHTAAALIEGRLPFWNPYIMLGVPHAANPQAALLYPASIMGFLLPVVTALVWDQILHLLWAGLGAYLLARSARLPRAGAAALATAYALSPFLVYRVTAGIPTLLAALSWAPWAWLAWLSGSALLLAAVFALQFFSGHPQFLVVNAAAMGLWAAVRPARLALWTRLAAGAGGALALAAVQWLPTLELLRGSNRSGWPEVFRAAYSLRPRDLLLWLSPGAFGTPLNGGWDDAISVFYESGGVWLGAGALALAAGGLLRGRGRLGPALLVVFGALLALGANGPLAPLLNAPGFSYLRTPSRWSFLSLWGLWLLAGAGARALGSSKKTAWALSLLPLVIAAELMIWDAGFLRAAVSSRFTKASPAVAGLSGRPTRVLTAPSLANPNKAVVYRMRNVNGYEAFYPASAALWAAEAEGEPAADPSWVLVSRWDSPAAARAGVSARLTPAGVEERTGAWPLATFLDANGNRLASDPALLIERPERWRVSGPVPAGAAAVALAETRWPGWRASLDGRAAPLRAWGPAFQAAALSPGAPDLELRFDFSPSLWFWWAALSAAAWGVWFSAIGRRAEAA
ncbi:MAG: hypothetical protein Q8T11_06390 [Elusimicrobiota bacterium]|nr:hypothetical protein [Elusimicrobiota bacterium]